jgi:hypothetical protein
MIFDGPGGHLLIGHYPDISAGECIQALDAQPSHYRGGAVNATSIIHSNSASR